MKPNVLWIYGEDLYPDLACYGNQTVQTPVLDHFASEGVLYTNAYATSPVCSPSRSAMITGRYQTSFGAHNHRSCRQKPLDANIGLVTEYFREAGYFTCNSSGPPYQQPGKTDFNFLRTNPFDGVHWSERQTDQPFYAQINITDTHRDFSPDLANPINPKQVDLPPYYPDHPLIQKDWAMWLESIQIFDRKVGQILRCLEKDGLKSNTIVFIISDHGRAHIRDKQFLYDGGIRIPCIVRWPDRIGEGSICDDLVSGIDFAPTSLSLCGLDIPEGMEGNVFLGKDAQEREYVVSARDRCDGTVDRIRCVRTKTQKYIRNHHPDRPYMQFNGYKKQQYPLWTLLPLLNRIGLLSDAQQNFLEPNRPYEEFYDLMLDPYEIDNRATDNKIRKDLAYLSDLLDSWTNNYGDQGTITENPEIVAAEANKMQTLHIKRMEAKGLSADVSDEEFVAWWESRLLDESRSNFHLHNRF